MSLPDVMAMLQKRDRHPALAVHRSVATLMTFGCVVASLTYCDASTPVEPDIRPSFSQQIDPNAPGNLTATPTGSRSIALTWTDKSQNETGFEVYRTAGGASGAYTRIAQTAVNTTKYIDAALDPVREYCYKVQAVAAKQRVIGVSNTACVTAPVKPPAASNVTAVPQPGPAIATTWRDNSLNESGFRVETSVTANGPWQTATTVGTDVTTTQQAAAAEVSRCYRIIAFNQFGDAEPSNADCTVSPARPTNLTAQAANNRSIDLAWVDNSAFEDGYEVVRQDQAGNRTVLTLPPGASRFHDAELVANVTYSYQVRASKDGGVSDFSNVATATAIPSPPSAPLNTHAFPGWSTAILVAWDEPESVSGFRVERSTDGGATWSIVTTIATPGISDVDVVPERSVCYRVVAFNNYGDSPYSNTSCTAPPAAPTELVATAVGVGTISLTWRDNSGVEDGYLVYFVDPWTNDTWPLVELPPNSDSYQFTDVPTGVEYSFFVVATKDGGSSDGSNYASATAFGAPPSPLGALVPVPRRTLAPPSRSLLQRVREAKKTPKRSIKGGSER